MPIGSYHQESGRLQIDSNGTYILLRDDGGRWRLDLPRRFHSYVGHRVSVAGVRDGFDWLAVRTMIAE